MQADLATLERRQAERYEHLAALQAVIDARQLEIDNRKAQPATQAVRKFKLVAVS